MSSVQLIMADPRDGARMAYGLNIRGMALGNEGAASGPENTYIQELKEEFLSTFVNYVRLPGAGEPGSEAWFLAILNHLRQDDRTFPIFESGDQIANLDAAMAYAMLRIRSAVLYETNTRYADRKNHLYLTGQGADGNIHLADPREFSLRQGGGAAAEEAAATERYRQMYDAVDPDPDVERGFADAEAGRARKLSFKDMVAELDDYEAKMKSGGIHVDSRLYRNITGALKKINDNWDKDPAEKIGEMLSAYEELGRACRRYIRERSGASTKLGRQRLSIVSDILRMQEKERTALELYRSRMQSSIPQEGKKPTLLDVATEARTIQIPENAPKVGGAMSLRTQIKEGPDRGFFTENKPFRKSLKEDYLERLNAETGITQEVKDNIAQNLKDGELFEEIEYMRNGREFMDFLQRNHLTGADTPPAELRAWQGLADDIDSYLSNRVPRALRRNTMREMLNSREDLPEAGKKRLLDAISANGRCHNLRMDTATAGPKYNILAFIPEAQQGNEALKEACIAFQNRYAQQTQSENTTHLTAGVPSESLARLNDRAIATSLMAGLLGCPDLVAQAQKARTGADGNAKDGMFMETADGRSGSDLRRSLASEGWRNNGCSPNVMRQLADLQILDVICGQCDRHCDNIIWETDANNYPISIKGIDHDMSFGVFDVENNGNYSSHLGLVRVVDQKTYEFVESLAKPENRALIEYKFKDLLNDREIDALWGRIDTVAQWLRQDTVRKVRPEEWNDIKWGDLVLKAQSFSDNIYKSADSFPDNIFCRATRALFPQTEKDISPTREAQRLYEEGIGFERHVRRQRDLSARNLQAQQTPDQPANLRRR